MTIDTSGLSLVGRESELAVITDFLVRAARGGGTLRLHGEPGIGKTALLDAAVSTTSAANTRVVRAEGVEHASSTISSGLNQVLLPLSGGLELLSPAHRDALAVALGLAGGDLADRSRVAHAARPPRASTARRSTPGTPGNTAHPAGTSKPSSAPTGNRPSSPTLRPVTATT